jgi:hypothetical protein
MRRLSSWTKRAFVCGAIAVVLWAITTLSQYWSKNDPAHFVLAFLTMEVFGFLAIMTTILTACFAGVARIDGMHRRR